MKDRLSTLGVGAALIGASIVKEINAETSIEEKEDFNNWMQGIRDEEIAPLLPIVERLNRLYKGTVLIITDKTIWDDGAEYCVKDIHFRPNKFGLRIELQCQASQWRVWDDNRFKTSSFSDYVFDVNKITSIKPYRRDFTKLGYFGRKKFTRIQFDFPEYDSMEYFENL